MPESSDSGALARIAAPEVSETVCLKLIPGGSVRAGAALEQSVRQNLTHDRGPVARPMRNGRVALAYGVRCLEDGLSLIEGACDVLDAEFQAPDTHDFEDRLADAIGRLKRIGLASKKAC